MGGRELRKDSWRPENWGVKEALQGEEWARVIRRCERGQVWVRKWVIPLETKKGSPRYRFRNLENTESNEERADLETLENQR